MRPPIGSGQQRYHLALVGPVAIELEIVGYRGAIGLGMIRVMPDLVEDEDPRRQLGEGDPDRLRDERHGA